MKEEFKLHKTASQNQYKSFLSEWSSNFLKFSSNSLDFSVIYRQKYYEELSGTQSLRNVGRNLSTEEFSLLNDEQKKTLDELKRTVKKPV